MNSKYYVLVFLFTFCYCDKYHPEYESYKIKHKHDHDNREKREAGVVEDKDFWMINGAMELEEALKESNIFFFVQSYYCAPKHFFPQVLIVCI